MVVQTMLLGTWEALCHGLGVLVYSVFFEGWSAGRDQKRLFAGSTDYGLRCLINLGLAF